MGARAVLLYDGHCRLCIAAAGRLARLASRDAVELRDFQQPGVLAAFPHVSRDECLRQMILVAPDGRTCGGAQAAVEALATRPLLGRLARAYYIPGLRGWIDAAYAWIARNRYRLFGRVPACDGGACALHLGRDAAPPRAVRNVTGAD